MQPFSDSYPIVFVAPGSFADFYPFMLDTISLLTSMRDSLTAIRVAVESTNLVVITMGGVLSDMKTTLIQVEANTSAIQSEVNAGNTLLDLGNSLTTGTNDLIQQYLGDVEGAVSTESVQDLLNAIRADLHDEATDLPFLQEITDAVDNSFHILESWDASGRAKVDISGPIEVEGTVSVEPGLVPLDVIVIP